VTVPPCVNRRYLSSKYGISISLIHLHTVRCRRVVYYIFQNVIHLMVWKIWQFKWVMTATLLVCCSSVIILQIIPMYQGCPARWISWSNLVKSHVCMFVSVSGESHFCTKCSLQSTPCACNPLTIPSVPAPYAATLWYRVTCSRSGWQLSDRM
jgi:hypothetical protein